MPTKGFTNGFAGSFGGSLNVATIALKVGDRSADPADYKDGDILAVWPRRFIRCVHAQHICHPRIAARNGGGLIPLTEVARDWYERTHQYRFERVSATEVRRTDLDTLEEDVLSGTQNADGEAMDVALFIQRRKQRLDNYLFGTPGAEVWYGGRQEHSHAKLDQVWNAIETKTAHREQNFSDWPAGVQDVKSHLLLRMNDMLDAEAETLVAPELDLTDPNNPVTIRKRARKVDWRALRELSPHVADIDNPSVSVDLRPQVGRLVRTVHDVSKS